MRESHESNCAFFQEPSYLPMISANGSSASGLLRFTWPHIIGSQLGFSLYRDHSFAQHRHKMLQKFPSSSYIMPRYEQYIPL
jgi:hypothetical protein